jgi:hypothetical protein
MNLIKNRKKNIIKLFGTTEFQTRASFSLSKQSQIHNQLKHTWLVAFFIIRAFFAQKGSI